MIEPVVFTVEGPPQGKGRPRFDGRSRRAVTPAKTRAYQRLIQLSAMPAMWRGKTYAALRVDLLIVLPRPKRLEKAEPGLLLIDKAKKPDADNVRKAVLDALSPWIVDDAQVAGGESLKAYAELCGEPRVVVRIEAETRDPTEWATARGLL